MHRGGHKEHNQVSYDCQDHDRKDGKMVVVEGVERSASPFNIFTERFRLTYVLKDSKCGKFHLNGVLSDR